MQEKPRVCSPTLPPRLTCCSLGLLQGIFLELIIHLAPFPTLSPEFLAPENHVFVVSFLKAWPAQNVSEKET